MLDPYIELKGESWEAYANGDTTIPFGQAEGAEQCGQEKDDFDGHGCGGVWPFCGCGSCTNCGGRATMKDEDNESYCDDDAPRGGPFHDTWAEYRGEK